MISPWRCALASAESKRKALPISLAFRLVTIHGFSWRGRPHPPFCLLLFLSSRWEVCTAAHAHFGLCVSPTGDILTSINGVNTEGFGHKQIVDLIKSSGNYLRWVCLLQMGFGLISCPTEGRIVLPHSPALSERQKSQGLGWVEPLCFRASITCSHRLETVNGALFLRKMELETKLQALKVM